MGQEKPDEKLKPTGGRDRFRGSLKTNEVEMDLDRFLDLVNENNRLDEEVKELKKERETNPWQKFVHLARTIDAWRIFPRAFITVYMVLLYFSVMWFMGLDDPTAPQSALISTIVGAGAAWFGLYVKSGGPTGRGDS